MRRILFAIVVFAAFINKSHAQWVSQYNSITGGGYQHIQMVNTLVGYACDSKYTYKTSNGGTTWAKIDSSATGIYSFNLSVLSATNVYILYSAGPGLQSYVKYSTNGGSTWFQTSGFGLQGEYYYDLHFTSATTGVVVGSSGKIYRTTNTGSSWSFISSGSSNSLESVHFPTSTTGYAVGSSGNVAKSTNGGLSWTSITSPTPAALVDVEFFTQDSGMAVGFSGIFRTTNGGSSWSNPVTQGVSALSYATRDTIFALTNTGGYVLRSANRGVNWDTLNQRYLVDIDFVSPLVGYGVYAGTEILKTTSGAFACPTISQAYAYSDTVCVNTNFYINVFSNYHTNLAPITFNVPSPGSFTTANNNGNTASISDAIISTPNVPVTFTVTLDGSGLGCPNDVDTFSVTAITNNYVPSYTQSTNMDSACVGDTLHMGPGAIAYQWIIQSGGNQLISNQEYVVVTAGMLNQLIIMQPTSCNGMGWQYLWLTPKSNCGSTSNCTLTAYAQNDISYCGNAPAQFTLASTASGAYTSVSWSPATYLSNTNNMVATLTMPTNNSVNTNYIVTYTDSVSGCSSSDTVHVFASQLINETYEVCGSGTPVVLMAHTNAQAWSWSPISSTSPILTVINPGVYYCQESYAGGCILTHTYIVADTCASSCSLLAVTTGDITICGGTTSSIGLVSTAAGSWTNVSWSPTTYLATPNAMTTLLNVPYNATINQDYVVTYFDAATGCYDSDTIHVFIANIRNDSIRMCGGQGITLSANYGASSYNWSPSGNNQVLEVADSSGQYYCVESHSNGCVITHSYALVDTCMSNPCMLTAFAAGNVYACGSNPGSVYLNSTASGMWTSISWSPTTYLNSGSSMSPLLTAPAGTTVNQNYIVTYTDSINGCTSSDTVHVFIANVYADSIAICGNSPTILSANIGASSYQWQPISSQQPLVTVNQTGSYTCVEAHSNGCYLTHIFTVYDSCFVNPCNFTINAGSNLNYCGVTPTTTVSLQASVSGTSTYTYQWSPQTGLSAYNILNPTITSPVYNQTYYLTVTDVNNGNCSLTDSVQVTFIPYQIGTIYNCNNSPVTIYNPPGAYYYQWMGGFNPLPPQNQNSVVVTAPGIYTFAAFYQGCAVTNQVTVVDSCGLNIPNVWPGDCNYDLTADYIDFLNISMAYGNTGASRAGASLMWTAQPMADWGNTSYIVDDKHSDCDGNGLVDTADVHAILQNYNNVHPYKLASPMSNPVNPDMYLIADKDTAVLGETVVFSIYLGKPSQPIDSIYAIAYQMTYDDYLTTSVGNVVYNNSFLGNPATNEISMEMPFTGQKDCGVGGNDHLNKAGEGKIGEVSIIVTTDNLSGLQYLNADLQNVYAITASGSSVPLNLSGDSVYIDLTQTIGINQADLSQSLVSVYPNPSKDEVFVNCGKLNVHSLNVYDMMGNLVSCEKQNTANSLIRLNGLAQGVYNISILTDKGLINKKLTIQQ